VYFFEHPRSFFLLRLFLVLLQYGAVLEELELAEESSVFLLDRRDLLIALANGQLIGRVQLLQLLDLGLQARDLGIQTRELGIQTLDSELKDEIAVLCRKWRSIRLLFLLLKGKGLRLLLNLFL